jgi:Rrf2 family nitric oxide-sensitive transcriptional repressor
MKLTAHTDYGLRVLMTLAVLNDWLVTIDELATRHRVSKNHLMKVAQTLVDLGLVESVRGRAGGLRLAGDPAQIRIGAVVRALEDDLRLVDCLGEGPSSCVLAGACRLTLADLVALRPTLRERLGIAA